MKINRVASLILAFAIIGITLGCGSGSPTDAGASSAAPSVQIRTAALGTNQVLDVSPGEEVLLSTIFSGGDLTFDWRVEGAETLSKTGPLKGIEGQSNRYTASQGSAGVVNEEIVWVTVTDERNISANDQLFIRIGSRELLSSNPLTLTNSNPNGSNSTPLDSELNQVGLELYQEKFLFTERGPLQSNHSELAQTTVTLSYDFGIAGKWFGGVYPVANPDLINQYETLTVEITGPANFEIKPQDVDMTNRFRKVGKTRYTIATSDITSQFGEMREVTLVVTPSGDPTAVGIQTFTLSLSDPKP